MLKVLFIGGTGLISTACTELAVARGLDLHLLNRGKRNLERQYDLPAGAKVIHADIADRRATADALAGRSFEAVVQFIAYNLDQVQADVELLRGRCGQYVFISTASAYLKPPPHYLITESTPLGNPFWQYARNKIACEEYLQGEIQRGFPATIVRPSLTYGNSSFPLAFRSTTHPWTIPDRLLRGLPVIVPGDGTSLWVSTHNSDFASGLVGLLGNPSAIGEAFHITSDEVLTWNDHYTAVARALGVEPKIVHLPSDLICAADDFYTGHLPGDKAHSTVFDLAKIKRFVPDFQPATKLADGLRQTVAWFKANPSRQVIDEKFNALCARLLNAYDPFKSSAVALLAILLCVLFIGCQNSPGADVRTRAKALAASQPTGLSAPQFDATVNAICVVPTGWKAEPLKSDDRHKHQVWLSPSGHTAYGIIYFPLPFPFNADFIHWNFIRAMKDEKGQATEYSRTSDPTLPGVRFDVDDGSYRIRANLIVHGNDGWTIYAGNRSGEEIVPEEFHLAEKARDATIPVPRSQSDAATSAITARPSSMPTTSATPPNAR